MISILNIKNKILKIISRKILAGILILIIPLFFKVYAQTSTSSASPTTVNSSEDKVIQNLKEKIVS